MIIEEKIQKVEQIGGGEESKFSIKISRKAFEILSGLYSDKPLAIMRELACNAVDSHIAAGKPLTPITVHLPNYFEPFLSIEDEGVGLSHDDIVRVYSTYFESTKTNDNNVVGCLGLGSKSPFCYTDNFTVVSRFNGVENTYIAFLDENGVPTLVQANSQKTNKVNGVSITIPVLRNDISLFVEAARKAFLWFPVRPNIIGADISYDSIEPAFDSKSPDWFYLKHHDGSAIAVMGGIGYPIEDDHFDYEEQKILRGLVIKFKMGQVDFTPSREALRYCDMTKKAISAKLAEIKETLCEIANQHLSEAKFLNEAQAIFSCLPENLKNNQKIEWNGIELNYSTKIKDVFGYLCERNWRNKLVSKSFNNFPLYFFNVNYTKIGFTYYSTKNPKNWKANCYLEENGYAKVVHLPIESVQKLVASGVDPSLFVDIDSLPYKKTKATLNGKTISRKCPVLRFSVKNTYNYKCDSIELIDAINDGAKFYIFKDKSSSSNFCFDREKPYSQSLREIAKALSSLANMGIIDDPDKSVIAIHPSKENVLIGAGLTKLISEIEAFFVKESNKLKEAIDLYRVTVYSRNNGQFLDFISELTENKNNPFVSYLIDECNKIKGMVASKIDFEKALSINNTFFEFNKYFSENVKKELLELVEDCIDTDTFFDKLSSYDTFIVDSIFNRYGIVTDRAKNIFIDYMEMRGKTWDAK